MNSNVIFQISTVLLALALAAVLIVVYVLPPDEGTEGYVDPTFNHGLLAIEDFHIADDSTESSAEGKIFAINDGEFKIKLIASMTIGENNPIGFQVAVWNNMVADSIYLEFNGDIEESMKNDGWGSCFYHEYGTHSTEIFIDSTYSFVTKKHGPGSGTLVADFSMDPKWRSEDVDTVEFFVNVGFSEDSHARFFLPAKDPDREVKGLSYTLGRESRNLMMSDPIEPINIRFEDQSLVLNLSPELSINEDDTFTFSPHLTIPAGQGKFRSLRLSITTENVLSATYTDFESMDPKASVRIPEYYLEKGADIESDRLEFTDSCTFALEKGVDKTHVFLNIKLVMSQDGILNTFTSAIDFHFSRSGIFYNTILCLLDSDEQNNPTYGQQMDFKRKVESGDVVYITGDFTKIARLTDIGVQYVPNTYGTAVIYDRNTGEFHSHVLYKFTDRLDDWAESVVMMIAVEGGQ